MKRYVRRMFWAVTILLGCAVPAGAETTEINQLSELIAAAEKAVPEHSKAAMEHNPSAHAIQQLKSLKLALARGDFHQAQQLLQSISVQSLMPDLREHWPKISDGIAGEILAGQRRASEDWMRSVDELVSKVRPACLEAGTSSDLDSMLVATAALQLARRPQDNIVAQRANEKLQGVVDTLSTWSRFLDLRENGNAKEANNVLRQMINSSRSFPVLPQAEIQKRFLSEIETHPQNAPQLVASAIADLSTVDDLLAAADRIEKGVPWGGTDMATLQRESGRLRSLAAASTALAEKNVETAERELRAFDKGSGMTGAAQNLQQMRTRVVSDILLLHLANLSEMQPDDGEDVNDFAFRIVEHFQEKGDFEGLAVIVASASRNYDRLRDAPEITAWTQQDAAALEAYSAALRFERAGDILPAINEYRTVVRRGGRGGCAPIDAAEAALTRLKKEYEDVFMDVSSMVLEEIRQLRLEILKTRSLGRPMSRLPSDFE